MTASFARPVGRDRGLASKMWLAVAAYWFSAAIAGGLTGLGLSFVGDLFALGPSSIDTVFVVLLLGLVLFASWLQWHGKVRPLPERQAQVPRRWLLWRSQTLTAVAFGFLLGSGFLTYLHQASAYVLAALILLAPSDGAGIAVGALYGSTWGLVLLVQRLRSKSIGEEKPRSLYGKVTLRGLSAVSIASSFLVVVLLVNV